MKLQVLAGFFLLSSLPGCSERSEASMPGGKRVDSSGGTVALGLGNGRASGSYKPAALSAIGAVAGTISLQGGADSTVTVRRDAGSCADSSGTSGTPSTGMALPDALVWVEGITSGKALQGPRRQTLVIENCRFTPRVLAVSAGTTINVFSRDRVSHTWRFFRENGGEPVEVIYTMDAGQVVPSERIANTPGIVEARDSKYPTTRGYIAVFDHPYHAVTDERGVFRIDSLPPGTYTMKVWHEGMAAAREERVVVAPGGTGRLDVAVALK
jgi:hypothetical protein